jgi:hypothetical protein
MNRLSVQAALTVAATGLLTVFATACGSGNDSAPAGAATISVKLTDVGHRDRGARRRNDPR